MKTRAGYVIRQLADTFYIIPTGQRIADRRRCLKINQTGCVIWDLLQKDLSWEELLSAYTEYAKSIEMTEDTKTVKPASIGKEASTVTAASISSDLSTYVLTLFQFGMIQASAKEMQAFPFAPFQAKENAYYCRYNIAGIQVHYKGRKEWLHAFFEPFLEDGKENPSAHTVKQSGISQSWRVRVLSEVPEITGELLLFGSQLDVYRCSGDYMLRFPSNHHLALCMLSFDGKEAVFYYDGSTQQEACLLYTSYSNYEDAMNQGYNTEIKSEVQSSIAVIEYYYKAYNLLKSKNSIEFQTCLDKARSLSPLNNYPCLLYTSSES